MERDFNSHRITLRVHQHVLRFIFSEVKMINSCFPKAKAIQVEFPNRITVLVLVIKARRLAYRRNRHRRLYRFTRSRIVGFPAVSIKYRLRTADCGLRTADCGLRTADCGLRTADCGLRTADCGLRTADCGLRTADCGLRTGTADCRPGIKHRARTADCRLQTRYETQSADQLLNTDCGLQSRCKTHTADRRL